MKLLKYLLTGIFFGIIMTKSEAISWYRIQEMFRFQSFHMYGIIGVAVILGILGVWIIKKMKLKNIEGNPIVFQAKESGIIRYLAGGTIFGLGWALTGACPGPITVNIGNGYGAFGIVFLFAILGTYLYGVFKDKLPH
ncbi:MAG: YeeE/YedE family protein [Pseudarcicella sp.]|nr:YeeE/YedE family protein [Pseudarcicella sp.]MBP6411070.1 YeeE/YedE family protein [Pseudarcicella sp.]